MTKKWKVRVSALVMCAAMLVSAMSILAATRTESVSLNGGGTGTNDGGGCGSSYDDEAAGGGGGATHIATTSGLLSTLENNKNSIIYIMVLSLFT